MTERGTARPTGDAPSATAPWEDHHRPPGLPTDRGNRRWPSRLTRRTGAAALCLAVVVGCAACGGSSASPSPASSTPTTLSPTALTAPLQGPKTTPAQDTRYLTDVTKADSNLVTYAQQQGNVGLQAMLTDGSAFCAFLARGVGLDVALLSVAQGAHSLESQTKLPENVTTYNTLESVALIDLCPSEQRDVPASVQAKLQALQQRLGAAGG